MHLVSLLLLLLLLVISSQSPPGWAVDHASCTGGHWTTTWDIIWDIN
jgi:hypothetical protein